MLVDSYSDWPRTVSSFFKQGDEVGILDLLETGQPLLRFVDALTVFARQPPGEQSAWRAVSCLETLIVRRISTGTTERSVSTLFNSNLAPGRRCTVQHCIQP